MGVKSMSTISFIFPNYNDAHNFIETLNACVAKAFQAQQEINGATDSGGKGDVSDWTLKDIGLKTQI